MEWDLNNWEWDGDLFEAALLNSVPADCRSRQFFPVESDILVNDENGKRELEKRRRGVDFEDGKVNDEAGLLNLELGGKVYPIIAGEEAKSGKKPKVVGAPEPSNRAVCQVEDCGADLSNEKDYNRRHKVCNVHSKATSALVGNVTQRFCQQCSRFHVLQEFDEGKRSCRKRLAGHNKRRRKTRPEGAVIGASLNDEHNSNNVLASLLRMLSSVHSCSSDQMKDQNLLLHLLRNLACLASSFNERNSNSLLPLSQDMQKNMGPSVGTVAKDMLKHTGQCAVLPASDMLEKNVLTDNAQCGVVKNVFTSQTAFLLPTQESISMNAAAPDTTLQRTKLNIIDLNNVYDDSQDCMENLQDPVAPQILGNMSPCVPFCSSKDPQTSIPPQNSQNPCSTSMQSPSTSSVEARILDWLSQSPTDIESYIRPGCVVLTIYLRMNKSTWATVNFSSG